MSSDRWSAATGRQKSRTRTGVGSSAPVLAVKQLGDRHAEHVGDPPEPEHRAVVRAVLDQRHEGTADPGRVAKLLLGLAGHESVKAHPPAYLL